MKKAGRGSPLVSLIPDLRLGAFQLWRRMRGNQETLVGVECGIEVRLAVRAGAVARSGADLQHCLLPCAVRLVSWVRTGSRGRAAPSSWLVSRLPAICRLEAMRSVERVHFLSVRGAERVKLSVRRIQV